MITEADRNGYAIWQIKDTLGITSDTMAAAFSIWTKMYLAPTHMGSNAEIVILMFVFSAF